MRVRITNSAEDSVSCDMDVTETEYAFLLKLAEQLCEPGQPGYAPTLSVEVLRPETSNLDE